MGGCVEKNNRNGTVIVYLICGARGKIVWSIVLPRRHFAVEYKHAQLDGWRSSLWTSSWQCFENRFQVWTSVLMRECWVMALASGSAIIYSQDNKTVGLSWPFKQKFAATAGGRHPHKKNKNICVLGERGESVNMWHVAPSAGKMVSLDVTSQPNKMFIIDLKKKKCVEL